MTEPTRPKGIYKKAHIRDITDTFESEKDNLIPIGVPRIALADSVYDTIASFIGDGKTDEILKEADSYVLGRGYSETSPGEREIPHISGPIFYPIQFYRHRSS